MDNADEDSGHISREAGDKQKGIRFQKLRAAIRFLERIEVNVAGRVHGAIELLEDSLLIDSSADAVVSGEENKLYSSALSFNSAPIKNTVVAFLDLKGVLQQSGELKLGIYASAQLADERIGEDVCKAAGLPGNEGMYTILKHLVAGKKLSQEELLIARQIALDEYRKQYKKKSRAGFIAVIESWPVDTFRAFLEQIDWSISVETNADLEAEALDYVRKSRFFDHRHEGLEAFILARLLDEFEKRSHCENAWDRLMSTADVQLIFMQSIGDAKLDPDRKPADPAGDCWDGVGVQDQRNLGEKILAVSPGFPRKVLGRLARRCALARVEAETFAREYVSLRRRILDVCEQQLECVQVPPGGFPAEDVNDIIETLTQASFNHLQLISKSYHYKINDIETTKGAVLSLFDDCFIAFDDHGTQ